MAGRYSSPRPADAGDIIGWTSPPKSDDGDAPSPPSASRRGGRRHVRPAAESRRNPESRAQARAQPDPYDRFASERPSRAAPTATTGHDASVVVVLDSGVGGERRGGGGAGSRLTGHRSDFGRPAARHVPNPDDRPLPRPQGGYLGAGSKQTRMAAASTHLVSPGSSPAGALRADAFLAMDEESRAFGLGGGGGGGGSGGGLTFISRPAVVKDDFEVMQELLGAQATQVRVMESRLSKVRTYRGFFASARGRKARLEAFEELSRCRDPAVVVDILNVILSRKKWFDIKVAEALLPTINGTLLSSQFEHYVATGVKVMLLVLKRHGNAIFNVLEGHGQDGSSSGDDDRYRRVYGLLVDAEEVLRGLASGNATTVVRLADRALQELATLT